MGGGEGELTDEPAGGEGNGGGGTQVDRTAVAREWGWEGGTDKRRGKARTSGKLKGRDDEDTPPDDDGLGV
jgi:hypothetical protein